MKLSQQKLDEQFRGKASEVVEKLDPQLLRKMLPAALTF